MAGTDGRAPWDDFKNLLRELELYDPALLDRPRLVPVQRVNWDTPIATHSMHTCFSAMRAHNGKRLARPI